MVGAIEDQVMEADSCALIEILAGITGEPVMLLGLEHHRVREIRIQVCLGAEGSGRKDRVRAPGRRPHHLPPLRLRGYDDLLSRLGKFRSAKSTIHLRRLDAVDPEILVMLLTRSVRHVDQMIEEMGGLPSMSEMPPYRKNDKA